MLNGMIKNNNNDNEPVTKGWFREAMREAMDEMAAMINKSFGSMESAMATKDDMLTLTHRIDTLEKYFDHRFDGISRELKEILKEIKTIDVRSDIFELRSRVTKLEQKAGL